MIFFWYIYNRIYPKTSSVKYTNSFKLVLIYLISGIIWIYFSDTIVAFFFKSKEQQLLYQTLKGFLYIISTSILLYILLRRFYGAQLDKIDQLRKKEYVIQESENRYQLLFKESPIANIVFDAQTGIILDTNDQAQTILGIYREQMVGFKISDILYDQTFIDNLHNLSTASDKHIIVHTRADNSAVKIEIYAHPFVYKGENCCLLLCNDITEREEAIYKLKENQRKLVTAQKIAKIGYWQYMVSSGEMYWSDEVYDIWGVKKGEFSLSYSFFHNSIHPHDRHLLPVTVPEHFDGLSDYDIEHRIILPDGEVKWVHEKGTYHYTEEGVPVYLEGTVQDITAQKLLSIALQQNLQRYNYVTRATSDAIWDWDLETNSIIWNNSSNNILLQLKSYVSHSDVLWEDHIIADDKNKVLASLKQAINSEKQYWSDEYRCQSADNSLLYVKNTSYILRNELGKAIRVIGAIQDITEKKRESLQNDLIAEFSIAFSNDLSLENMLSAVLDSLIKIGKFDLAEAWIVGKEKKHINLIAYSAEEKIKNSLYALPHMPVSFTIGQGMPGMCWASASLMYWDNLANNPLFIRSFYAEKSGITSMYAIPLKHNNDIVGVVLLGLVKDNLDSKIFSTLLERFNAQLASEICRKQTELELNQLFDFAPDIVCIAGIDGYYKKVNPAMTTILGYTQNELLAKPVTDFVHPDDVAKTIEQLEALKKGKPTIYFENRYITQSGAIKWMAWTATPPSNEGLVFSVGKDITDKKELELLLFKATSLANIGAWEIDMVTNQLHWSAITRRIHGIEDDSYNPDFDQAVAFYAEGESRNVIMQKVTNAITKGEKWDIESQIVTLQNELKWIRSIGEPEFVEGKCIRIVGSFQDISHLKNAEKIAIETLKEKEMILERIGDAFYAVDLQWTITYWNNKAEQILGKKKTEVLGHNLWEVFADAIDTPFYTFFHEVAHTGVPRYFEEYYAGTKAWYEVGVFPSPTGLSIFFKDITERRNYIKDIVGYNKALREIAWIQSHVVRSPLSTLMGLVELLKHKDKYEIDEADIINKIQSTSESLDRVIHDIVRKAETVESNFHLNSQSAN